MVQKFTDLLVWQRSHDLALLTYKLTKLFPQSELFSLTNQMQRSAVSITSNLAEGFGRRTVKDKMHFYYIARGSLTELHNQFILSKDLKYIKDAEYQTTLELITRVYKLLNAMIGSLARSSF